MSKGLKVRFAPSPTGFLHIGSARTALFNWLFAKKYNASFILRIEDTDLKRSRDEFLNEIMDSLRWLGLRWDEVYYQSRRFDLYREYAQKLLDNNKAAREDGAIVFKYQFEKIEFNDLIRGGIEFSELPRESEVLIKSDGTPTYSFACCVDDALLGITHVIRGEDHIPNTPKQILIYKALGFEIPQFAHLPMILSPEGGKMSKRFGATAIKQYKADGYLPQALTNYLLLLGWSPKDDREIIGLKEAASLFDIKDVNKTAAAFSLEKLDWINSEHIKNMPAQALGECLKEYLESRDFLPENTKKDYLESVAELFKTRLRKLSDFISRAYFCFYDDYSFSPETRDILNRDLSPETKILSERFSGLESFDKMIIEKEFRAVAQDAGLKVRDLVHPVRVALSGGKVGPGLFETMEVLGKERVLARLKRLIDYWQNKG